MNRLGDCELEERSPSYYEILGVSDQATLTEIKKAYRRLVRLYHPDVNPHNPDAVDQFQHITQIYQVLSDTQARAAYDASLGSDRPPPSVNRSSSSSSASDYYQDGLKESHGNNYARAIELFTQALELNPSLAEAYCQRGFAYHRSQQDSLAFADYAEALKLSPTMSLAYYYRGLTRFKLGYPQSAIEDYTKAIEFNSSHAQAFYHRGLAHADLNETQAALNDLEQASRLFQKQGNRLGLARIKVARKQLTRTTGWHSALKGLLTLLPDVWDTAWRAVLNPVGGLPSAFARLSPGRAIATGLLFAVGFTTCFALGLMQFRQRYFSQELPLTTALMWGILPFVGMVFLLAIARLIWGNSGPAYRSIYVAGVALLPVSAMALAVSQITSPILFFLAPISISYFVLLTVSGCTQLEEIPEAIAAPISATMLLMVMISFWAILNSA